MRGCHSKKRIYQSKKEDLAEQKRRLIKAKERKNQSTREDLSQQKRGFIRAKEMVYHGTNEDISAHRYNGATKRTYQSKGKLIRAKEN